MESILRSSCPEVFCKKALLRNFAKFIGKHLCQSIFLNKVVGLRPATLLKNRLWYRCFPVNFAKFLKTPLVAASAYFGLFILTEHQTMSRTTILMVLNLFCCKIVKYWYCVYTYV